MDVQIDGIHSVHPIVTAWQTVLVFIGGQITQINSLVAYRSDGYFLQRAFESGGGKVEGVLLIANIIPHFAYHIALAQEALYAILNIMGRQSVGGKHHGIVGDHDVFAASAAHLYPFYILMALQLRNHLALYILFQLFIAEVGIHLITEQHLGGFLLSAVTDHLATRQLRIADTLGQLLIDLTKQ